MTDLIERLARDAGIKAIEDIDYRRSSGMEPTAPEQKSWEIIMRFAALVAEECARACDYLEDDMGHGKAQQCADKIRALFSDPAAQRGEGVKG